jgi:hypothetical protein
MLQADHIQHRFDNPAELAQQFDDPERLADAGEKYSSTPSAPAPK